MLLTTKFYRPTPDARSVYRKRLLDLLEPDGRKRLNLLIAPAGYGKTTLASQWHETSTGHCAWLSLDDYDDDPRRFWQYVVGAFAHSGLDGLADARTQLTQLPEDELDGAVVALLNRLSTADPWFLVIDDFHLIRSRQVNRQFSFLIDHLPPNVTVTLLSRSEPELPLSRWRVRNWLAEISPTLLSFSPEESLRFFRDYMQVPLTSDQSRHLWEETEGWAAAMQLSALSGHRDSSSRTPRSRDLSVDHHKIHQYVSDEVLDNLTDEVRRFLLETACCMRLNASLCDAVRGRDDSQPMLENLSARNLFIIPLDVQNRWFRYHDLFREALVQRANQLDPEAHQQRELRAIEWLLDNDQVQEAIQQIVLKADWQWLARVLKMHGNTLIHGGFHLPVLRWLNLLPPGVVSDDPRLMMLEIWALFFANRVDRIEPQLNELENLLDIRVAESHSDADGALGLHSEISLMRSYLARSRHDSKSASDLTQQVLKDIDTSQIPLKSVTYYGIGLDYFEQGAMASAEEALLSAVSYGQLERKPSTVLSSGGLLAWTQLCRGAPDQALRTGRELRQWVDQLYDDTNQPTLISCWQNAAFCEIYRERNQIDLAESYLTPLLTHVQQGTEAAQHVVIQYVRARLAFTRGQIEAALAYLDDAELVVSAKRDHMVFEPPACDALRAECLLALNQREVAELWFREHDAERFHNPINRLVSHLGSARVRLASGDAEAAMDAYMMLTEQCREIGDNRNLMQAMLGQAEALLALDRTDEARPLCQQALSLAAGMGFISLLAEQSSALRQQILLESTNHGDDAWRAGLQKRLSGMGERSEPTPQASEPVAPQRYGRRRDDVVAAPDQTLPEPLSQRELEVLALINSGLQNKQIASELDVAEATVKAHIRNLYGKLGVKRRTEALAKARDLRLI